MTSAMKKIASLFLYLAAMTACVAFGLLIGPVVRGAYAHLVPGPAYVTGDFSALYREAGKPVVLFSTSTCPHCKSAREFLDGAHVGYRDFLVDESPEAQQRFKALKGDAVPLLFVGDRRIVGFREDTLRESLALIQQKSMHSE